MRAHHLDGTHETLRVERFFEFLLQPLLANQAEAFFRDVRGGDCVLELHVRSWETAPHTATRELASAFEGLSELNETISCVKISGDAVVVEKVPRPLRFTASLLEMRVCHLPFDTVLGDVLSSAGLIVHVLEVLRSVRELATHRAAFLAPALDEKIHHVADVTGRVAFLEPDQVVSMRMPTVTTVRHFPRRKRCAQAVQLALSSERAAALRLSDAMLKNAERRFQRVSTRVTDGLRQHEAAASGFLQIGRASTDTRPTLVRLPCPAARTDPNRVTADDVPEIAAASTEVNGNKALASMLDPKTGVITARADLPVGQEFPRCAL